MANAAWTDVVSRAVMAEPTENSTETAARTKEVEAHWCVAEDRFVQWCDTMESKGRIEVMGRGASAGEAVRPAKATSHASAESVSSGTIVVLAERVGMYKASTSLFFAELEVGQLRIVLDLLFLPTMDQCRLMEGASTTGPYNTPDRGPVELDVLEWALPLLAPVLGWPITTHRRRIRKRGNYSVHANANSSARAASVAASPRGESREALAHRLLPGRKGRTWGAVRAAPHRPVRSSESSVIEQPVKRKGWEKAGR
ncbi:hypothetical protein EDB85DRAFT_1897241 [Lactarius pseudohatsudake]|nr:hypothetical protein EDB85DRAFT_1897241 [Lactarius pseudohatsudake]